MKITIEKNMGVWSIAVVTCTDGAKISCATDEDVLKEVKIFLNEIKT